MDSTEVTSCKKSSDFIGMPPKSNANPKLDDGSKNPPSAMIFERDVDGSKPELAQASIDQVLSEQVS
jgi:hypothetical protein